MLFTLRYRTHSVREALIEADDEPQAEAIGKAWCDKTTRSGIETRCQFISVYPAVVADKSILKSRKPDIEEVTKAPKAAALAGKE